jgi:hypothetical protein
LIETLFYIFLLVIVFTVITGALYGLARTYRNIQASAALENTAQLALERITRETRGSSSVDEGQSIFGVTEGRLVLNTIYDDGGAMVIEFLLSDGAIRVIEDGVDTGRLTPSRARVTRLMFRPVSSAQSRAVKVELEVESGSGESYRSKSFYSTVVLRGSYPLQ